MRPLSLDLYRSTPRIIIYPGPLPRVLIPGDTHRKSYPGSRISFRSLCVPGCQYLENLATNPRVPGVPAGNLARYRYGRVCYDVVRIGE
eukprot:2977175-Rhodomonas_salina.1